VKAVSNKINQSLNLDKYGDYLLPLGLVCFSGFIIKDYFIPSIQITFGILAAPFVFKLQKKNVYSHRFLVFSTALILAYYFLHVAILLFLSLGSLMLYTIEGRIGKLGFLPFLFLICISPAFYYLVNTFTFSIRLELSHYASLLLNSIGMAVENKGAFFILKDGTNFSVDKACIGLNMFNTGLSLSVLLMAFSEQSTH
jgi:hypothetical protein